MWKSRPGRELVAQSYGGSRRQASAFVAVYATFAARLGHVCCGIRWFLTVTYRARLVQLAVLTGLVLAPSASAYETPPTLAKVAHAYSFGVGEVRCASREEWDGDFASAVGGAYTNVRDEYTVLGPQVCEGALNVGSANVPLWQQALGALVLTHEAFHLRRWRFRRNEGKVECQAMVYFKDAAQRLGATTAQADDLYPYALALHAHHVRLFPAYKDPKCVIPPWAPPKKE
jgi:hypothetical protein